MIKNSKKLIVILSSIVVVLFGLIGFAIYSKAEGSTATNNDNKNKSYYVTSSESSVQYDSYNYISKQGVLANLVEKDSLYFNNLIDLAEFSKNETFIEVAPVTTKRGSCEYFQITLDIIDAYDSSNYITVRIRTYPNIEDESNVVFINTYAANGQHPTSLDRTDGSIHVDSQYGLWVYGALSCLENQNVVSPDKNYIGLTFDYKENKIYCKEHQTNSLFLIADFDDPDYFGNETWKGFKDGKVYARVKCADYQTSEAKIMVRKYGNYDLSNNVLIDDIAPVITINNDGYDLNNLPKALVGHKYYIPSATSYDVHEGAKKTEVNVYLNYYTDNKIKINSKGNVFIPQLPSICYIEYSSVDSKANVSKKVYEVEAISSLEPINIDFNNFINQAEVGAFYNLPSYIVSGGSGRLDVKVKALLNNKELVINNNSVQPLETGKMVIEYTITDYLKQEKVVTKEVTISSSTHLFFNNVPNLPKYLIKGNTYHLDDLYAYDFITLNGEKVKSVIYANEGSSDKQLSNNEYTVGNTTKATIIYRATSSGVTEIYSKEIDVIDINTDSCLDMAKLFAITGNGITKANFDSVSLKSSTASSFKYINVLPAVTFNTEFKINPSTSKVGKINIILTDYEDDNNKIKLTYEYTSSGVYFYVNGDDSAKQKVNVDINKLSSYLLVYKNTSKSVVFDATSNKNIIISNNVNGDEFNGFNSGLCYAEFQLENVTSASEILVTNIACQYLNDEYADFISPVIDAVTPYGGDVVLNDIVSLPTIIAIDGISGKLKTYIKVTDPSGEIVDSIEGAFLNNSLYLNNASIKLTKYGQYNVTFSSKDDNNNEISLSYGIRVIDVIRPEITLKGELKEQYKVGDTVNIPAAKVKDNLTQSPTLKIYIFTPNGKKIDVSKDYSSFTASEKGVYKIVYMVIDENGNYQSIVKTIKAE